MLTVRRMLIVSAATVVVALTVSSCTSAPQVQVSLSAEQFSALGVTESINNGAMAQQEAYITSCLRKAGFEHTPQEIRTNQTDLIGGRGPVRVYYDQIDQPEVYSFGSGSYDPQTGQAIPAPPEERQAYDSCLADWDKKFSAETSAVESDIDRLYARWTKFSASRTYLDAMDQWSSCMKTKGFDFATIDAATQYLTELVSASFPDAGSTSDPAAVRAELTAKEAAVQGAAQQCWAGTLKPVLEQYNKELVQDFGTQIAAIQAAYSGKSS